MTGSSLDLNRSGCATLGMALRCRPQRTHREESGVTFFCKAARNWSFRIGGKWWIAKPAKSKNGVSFGFPFVVENRSVTACGFTGTKAQSDIPALCGAGMYGVAFSALQKFCVGAEIRLVRSFALCMKKVGRQSW